MSRGTLGNPAGGYGGAPAPGAAEDFEEGIGYHAPKRQPIRVNTGNDVDTSAPAHSGEYFNKPAFQPSYGRTAPSNGGYSTLTPISPPSQASQRRTKPQNGYGGPSSYGEAPAPASYGANSVYGGANGNSEGNSKSSAYDNAGYGTHADTASQGHQASGGQTWEPYSFAYSAEDAEGLHSHSAQGDAQGRVKGEYTIQLADGRSRTVK